MKTKKLLSVVLIALMLLSCIPIFASAAVSLTYKNVEIIPPTISPTEVNYGAGIANVEVTGGKLWYVDENGTKTEVDGYFDLRSKATANPINCGAYTPQLVFYPTDTETYGTMVDRLAKNRVPIVSGEWPSLYIRGAYTEIVTPPSFSCDAGINLAMYPNYTKTGGKVVDADGKDVTSYGQFQIDEAGTGKKNQYLYEDTYVTAMWQSKSQTGYDYAYYENVLVKVTKVTATLNTAPTIPAVYVGTTIGEAMEQLTATVTLKGTGSYSDTSAKFWEVNYPEGCDANTPITEDMTLSVSYNHPGATNTLTADVAVSTYSRPLAVITELPTASTVGIKPGMKVSALTLTGGKAVLEGSETEVAGMFSFVEPDALLRSNTNTLKIAFTPDDLSACEPTEGEIKVSITSLIINKPTVEVVNFKEGMTAADVVITGGETTEPGTFSVMYPDGQLRVGFNSVEIKFTPSAEGAEYFDTFNAVLNLKYKIRFVDADGNDIIPEIKTIPGVLLEDKSSIAYSLFSYLECKRNTVAFFDMEGNSVDGSKVPVGRHQYQVYVTTKDTNYEPAMLTFFLTLEPTYFNATTRYNYVNHYLTVVPDNKSVTDEFDVWVDGELIGTTTDQKIKWATDESRDYNVTLVHKDTTEGVYALANTEYTMTVKIPREIFRSDSGLSFTATGSTYPGNNNYAYKGDVLTLTCTDETFYNWQLSIGGEDWIPEGLTAEDLKKPTITFTMPDCDIFACPNDESRFAAAADCDHLCHSENPIYQFFWKILHFFFRLLNIQQYCDCGMLHYESAIFG